MENVCLVFLSYSFLSLMIVLLAGEQLSKGGTAMLIDYFNGDEVKAETLNNLWMVFFYLMNFGFILYCLDSIGDGPYNRNDIMKVVSAVGANIIYTGIICFLILTMITRSRKRIIKNS